MKGPRGIQSPGLDPLSTLGIEAQTPAERRKFAEKWVKEEFIRTQKELDFQREVNAAWQRLYLGEYLLATVWISIITLVRVTILVLSVPLFVLVVVVALIEGLGRRDLRRYGAGYESSFVYHHAKKLVKPATVVPPSCIFPGPRRFTPICCCCRRLSCWGSP